MAKLTEGAKWEDGIYQIETSDPVVGGPDGVTNRPARELANRTVYLKQKQEQADQALTAHAASRNHPDGTLTEKGFVQLSNAVNSDSETLAATPKAVKIVNDEFIKMNTKIDGMVKTLPVASLTQQGIVQLSSAVDSASETLAATPKAVKTVMDKVNEIDGRVYTVADGSLTQKGIVQLSNAINSDADTLAATPKAIKTLADDFARKLGGLSSEDSGALKKIMNGADIPDKPAFIRNLGLRNGTDGAPGPAGPMGPRGLTGATGPIGPRGSAGPGNRNSSGPLMPGVDSKGWWRCGDTGLLIQWGKWNNPYPSDDIIRNGIPASVDLNETFTITYPRAPYYLNAVIHNNMPGQHQSIINTFIRIKNMNSAGFIFQVGESIGVVQNISVYWFAIGY